MALRDVDERYAGLPESSGARRVARAIDNLVAWITRHWLAFFNTLAGIFFILPFLAPVFMHVGLTGPGRLIYLAYSPTCHQLPERSYFFFGPKVVYSTSELADMGALPPNLNLFQREMLRWPGSPAVGYKVAFCERDAAIYGSLFLGGLVFALVRKRYLRPGRQVPRLRFWAYALFLAPMAVDGFTQLFGWRESDWFLRSITGILFGAATVWLAYPYVQEAMDDVRGVSMATAQVVTQGP